MDGVVPVVGPVGELVHRCSYNWIKALDFTSGGHQEQRIGTPPVSPSHERRRPTHLAIWDTLCPLESSKGDRQLASTTQGPTPPIRLMVYRTMCPFCDWSGYSASTPT